MRANKGISSGRSVSGLFVFLLIGMYAIFSLLLVLVGAGVYQGIANDADHNSQMRTSLSYIASKVRAGDEAGAVIVEYQDDKPILVLRQRYADEAYKTRIYFLPGHEGSSGALYELFSLDDEEDELDLEIGERIADVSAFDVREVDGCVELSVTMKDGTAQSMRLRLRSQAAR